MSKLDKYRMLVKRFVQNYYELNGKFDKIELSVLGKEIRALAEEVHLDILQFCYTQLGYPADISKDDLQIFAQYQVDNLDFFVDNGYVTDTFEVPDYMKSIGYKRKRVFREKKYSKKVEPAIEALTKYYNESTELHACVNNTDLTTKQFIAMLKLNASGRMSANDLIAELEKVGLLVKFKKGEFECIQNGVFYYEDYTLNQLQKIQKEAILNITFGLYLINGVIHNIPELPFLALNNNNIYLSLLDMCRGLGITYAEYMLNFGYVIKDQTLAIQENSMFINKVGDSVYITDLNSDVNHPVYVQTLSEFAYNAGRVPFKEIERMELF